MGSRGPADDAVVSMPDAATTVLVVGPVAGRRRTLTRELSMRPGLRIVGEAGDAQEAMAEIRGRKPQVAVVEYELPGRDGAELARDVRDAGLATRVVLLSSSGRTETLVRGIAFGAATAVPVTAGMHELYAAIVAVGRGRTRLPPVLQDEFVKSLRARWVEESPSLTRRQQEVLELVAEGLSAPRIAEQLGLSLATVKSHLENLYGNLGVADRASAVAVAMRAGILS